MSQILLLSSTKFLIKNPQLQFAKPLKEMRMLYITTASKGVTDIDYLARAKNIFAANSYTYEELDIEDKTEDWLRNKIQNFDVVYMQGGNTYYLLKAVRATGFDSILKESITQGLIYIGASAGSYIACPTIEMAGYRHQDLYNHFGITDITGLNLVPFLVSVHYSPEYKEILKERIMKSKYPVRILTDEQGLLIQDEKVVFLGTEPEIIL